MITLSVIESQTTRLGHGGCVTERHYAVYLNDFMVNAFSEYHLGTGAKSAMEKYVAGLEATLGTKAIRGHKKEAA